jgi:RimJ/RimL family protein N-acetyltransferase
MKKIYFYERKVGHIFNFSLNDTMEDINTKLYTPRLMQLALHKNNFFMDLMWFLLCKKRYKILYILDGERIMHYSYLVSNNIRMPFMEKNSYCIINSYTKNTDRNKSVFTYALDAAQLYLGNTKNCYIFVDSENLPSKKAIEKAGFVLIGYGHCAWLLRKFIIKNYINFQHKLWFND